jgi:hypothetical protein
VGPRPDVAALDAGGEVLKKSREKIDLSREQDRDTPKPDIKQIAHCSRNLKPATELFKSGQYPLSALRRAISIAVPLRAGSG